MAGIANRINGECDLYMEKGYYLTAPEVRLVIGTDGNLK
jgi:hypothetical protein